ncbi:hypothetical protein VP01_1656g4 [Puccinia sorghi]|uniref:JmjC domain-containing protein n=1 Tax=Puccinia sorghi TaxID=27349 RepID=A0A0L6VI88_9BASI|nr:hypothetical protein VP01_1656g4 [Puccinia sorghi]
MDILVDDPSYTTFLQEYLLPNRPVLIRSGRVTGWPASTRWTAPTADGLEPHPDEERRADLAGLVQLYGHLEVPVVKQRITVPRNTSGDRLQSARRISGQENDCMPFTDVANCWQKKLRDPPRPREQQDDGQVAVDEEELIYLKDWHLMRICEQKNGPKDRDEETGRYVQNDADLFYQVPEIFSDDWMNDYYSAETDDDFRFVYIGERGTMTELHTDVYNSYSWSANIVGRKGWRMFSPDSTEILDFEQGPGEIIFVWCNSVNLPSVYDALAKDVEQVKTSIADVKDLLKKKWDSKRRVSPTSQENHTGTGWELEWIEVVQELTKQHSGWNSWMTFWKMVRYIVRRDLKQGSSTPWPSSQAIRPCSPPAEFVKTQINTCVCKFKTRHEFQLDSTLQLIILEIEPCLSTFS